MTKNERARLQLIIDENSKALVKLEACFNSTKDRAHKTSLSTFGAILQKQNSFITSILGA